MCYSFLKKGNLTRYEQTAFIRLPVYLLALSDHRPDRLSSIGEIQHRTFK